MKPHEIHFITSHMTVNFKHIMRKTYYKKFLKRLFLKRNQNIRRSLCGVNILILGLMQKHFLLCFWAVPSYSNVKNDLSIKCNQCISTFFQKSSFYTMSSQLNKLSSHQEFSEKPLKVSHNLQNKVLMLKHFILSCLYMFSIKLSCQF